MITTRILFRREPRGMPVPPDFETTELDLPPPGPGEMLVRGLYLSLDPYMRMLMGGGWQFRGGSMTPGQVMVGRVLGEVVESNHPDHAPGDRLVGSFGWQTHAISDGSDVEFKVSPRGGVPLAAYLGACGSNGLTAWAGVKLVGSAKAGETVLVSAAAGSVGSAAGQVARDLGCRTIGIAGGTEKCRLATDELGFDACCDYKADGLAAAVAEAAGPGGVDLYFDNVGGAMLDAMLPLLGKGGRVAVCGVLSQYNAAESDFHGVRNTRLIFDRSLRLEGFLLGQFRDRWEEGRAELEALVASGRLRYRETLAEGIESAPEAFIGMLKGHNVGKQLVKLA